ncbi:MAG TPA: ABC transporter ATP-binding protein [Pseudonocardiaceae bacterium]|jgi:branched-chain amino acid transport system ATP-binding protein|nr:ABC transporter ATP-binding protein [Pseudonocardiaceae bacterium]
MNAMLSVDDITLTINGTQILENVSFEVAPGETLGLIGPNGAGKSSILNCVGGIYQPQSGSIRFRDRDVFRVRPHALSSWGMARTFQAVSLDADESVRDNVMLGADLGAMSRHTRVWFPRSRNASRRAADEAMALLGLTSLADARAGGLPYGIQRSVELARAVAMRPTLLCLDEPTSGMSPAEKRAIADLLTTLRQGGLTLLIIEHDVPFMTGLCQRLVALNFGVVLAEGTPSEVLASQQVIESYLHPAGDLGLDGADADR